ncbi:MBL fold metallo-hydrolase [Formosa sp. L2A11]|uniref:MBL fold metallo-hydrolase n=1 Tax=Formosa sp. L2A11 TaxID=2686363 RepID=UPI0018EED5C5|nr:MBL fold metallo-hydrolase [Formosa sp. L2A11]
MFKKTIKRMGIIIGVSIVLIEVIGIIFLYTSPEFGGSQTAQKEAKFAKTDHYKDGKFVNLGAVDLSMGIKEFGKMLSGYFNQPKNVVPNHLLQVESIIPSDLENYNGKTRLFWFGHSTFLLQMNSKNILIDPMFGSVPAPHPMLGTKRFSTHLPIAIEDLPHIDAVLISHDHYDHLDYGSIIKLKDKVDQFYTPLGVGAHLESWGIPKNRIHELDWWDTIDFSELTFINTPAQHFSGRGLTDKGKTLWSSWIIKSNEENIFFSGDSGYGPHFKEIGDKYGPFDFAMMECGQYNALWHEIHMYPEETAQAAIDIKAKRMMPIHWGAFKLATHNWTEPVERLKQAAKTLRLKLITPRIGAAISIENTSENSTDWWK